jgi:hypothetical protein
MTTTTSITTNTPANPNRRLINEEVQITGMYFRSANPDDRHIKGYPKRMEYEGREYTFVESGLRYLMRKGQQLVEVFDMTDGIRDFRLKFDSDQHIWTLVGMKEDRNVTA